MPNAANHYATPYTTQQRRQPRVAEGHSSPVEIEDGVDNVTQSPVQVCYSTRKLALFDVSASLVTAAQAHEVRSADVF